MTRHELIIEMGEHYPFNQAKPDNCTCLIRYTRNSRHPDFANFKFKIEKCLQLKHPNLICIIKAFESRKNSYFDIYYEHVQDGFDAGIKKLMADEIDRAKKQLIEVVQYLISQEVLPQISSKCLGFKGSDLKLFLQVTRVKKERLHKRDSLVAKSAEINYLFSQYIPVRAVDSVLKLTPRKESADSSNCQSAHQKQSIAVNTECNAYIGNHQSRNNNNNNNNSNNNIGAMGLVRTNTMNSFNNYTIINSSTMSFTLENEPRNSSLTNMKSIAGTNRDSLAKIKNIDEKIKQLNQQLLNSKHFKDNPGGGNSYIVSKIGSNSNNNLRKPNRPTVNFKTEVNQKYLQPSPSHDPEKKTNNNNNNNSPKHPGESHSQFGSNLRPSQHVQAQSPKIPHSRPPVAKPPLSPSHPQSSKILSLQQELQAFYAKTNIRVESPKQVKGCDSTQMIGLHPSPIAFRNNQPTMFNRNQTVIQVPALKKSNILRRNTQEYLVQDNNQDDGSQAESDDTYNMELGEDYQMPKTLVNQQMRQTTQSPPKFLVASKLHQSVGNTNAARIKKELATKLNSSSSSSVDKNNHPKSNTKSELPPKSSRQPSTEQPYQNSLKARSNMTSEGASTPNRANESAQAYYNIAGGAGMRIVTNATGSSSDLRRIDHSFQGNQSGGSFVHNHKLEASRNMIKQHLLEIKQAQQMIIESKKLDTRKLSDEIAGKSSVLTNYKKVSTPKNREPIMSQTTHHPGMKLETSKSADGLKDMSDVLKYYQIGSELVDEFNTLFDREEAPTRDPPRPGQIDQSNGSPSTIQPQSPRNTTRSGASHQQKSSFSNFDDKKFINQRVQTALKKSEATLQSFKVKSGFKNNLNAYI